ncbi:unnamed protein product [Schistosoma mattheei]|uniref:Uncharacterized protein n=1 Tax=Schistosoma mattheei TaxID=31246 RepID=A0A183PAL9_9TREM|nr:unnamed protein product [Schistosoma mattheei]
MLLYSSHGEENAPHTQGVALMLSKVARNELVGWESHGSRIIKASFTTKKEGITMNIIQCYAPTNDSNENIKDQFYERLHSQQQVTSLTGPTEGRRNYYGGQLEKYQKALSSACHEVLGLKKHHHTEWISIETLDKIKERKNKKTAINNSRTRTEKVQAQAEYVEVNKQVKKSIRADKKKYVEELATTMEKAAREGNMKQLYDTTKKTSREIQSVPTNPPDIEAAHTDLPIDVNPPTTEEIRMAIRQIKSGKAAGPDNIPAKELKSDIEVTIKNASPSIQKDLAGGTSADGLERRTPHQDSKERRSEQM